MSCSKTLQQAGHPYCPECHTPIPPEWLGCPECAGMVKIRGHWVAPNGLQPKAQSDEEQPGLFVFEEQEYPA
jgi:hypothetical protein